MDDGSAEAGDRVGGELSATGSGALRGLTGLVRRAMSQHMLSGCVGLPVPYRYLFEFVEGT